MVGTLSFTTTSMPRPELLERTYRSFSINLKGCSLSDFKLFINVDPFVDDAADYERNQCIQIAKKYFKEVIWRRPVSPNFSMALKWLWSNAKDDYIFNL
ncbi:MAG: hypothetical protein IPH16_17215 [Haliscomenobacter sp.]|nr:hypothetical protein [Haliscomenobacter sp.]